jgi:hypothetical protein
VGSVRVNDRAEIAKRVLGSSDDKSGIVSISAVFMVAQRFWIAESVNVFILPAQDPFIIGSNVTTQAALLLKGVGVV